VSHQHEVQAVQRMLKKFSIVGKFVELILRRGPTTAVRRQSFPFCMNVLQVELHSNLNENTVGAVYQAAHDALQSARALEGGANSAGNRSSQEGETPPPPPSPADSTYDESTDDAGWIYTDHPRQSDQ